MNAQSKIEAPTLAKLREAFPANHISKLPKESRRQIDERKDGKNIEWNCSVCGGMHHKNAVHLDYVGHAAVTDRLLDTDQEWTWEPVAFGADGLPALDRNGGLWIKLTVLGVTRLGYGHADGKNGGDAVKEAIGDALRNAGMRFGMALDLWHKGDLHADDEAGAEPKAEERKPAQRNSRQRANEKPPEGPQPDEMPDAEWAHLSQLLTATKTQPKILLDFYKVKNLRHLSMDQYDEAVGRLNGTLARMADEEARSRPVDNTRSGDGQGAGQNNKVSADDLPPF